MSDDKDNDDKNVVSYKPKKRMTHKELMRKHKHEQKQDNKQQKLESNNSVRMERDTSAQYTESRSIINDISNKNEFFRKLIKYVGLDLYQRSAPVPQYDMARTMLIRIVTFLLTAMFVGMLYNVFTGFVFGLLEWPPLISHFLTGNWLLDGIVKIVTYLLEAILVIFPIVNRLLYYVPIHWNRLMNKHR